MAQIKRIMTAVDFSETGQAAASQAAELAQRLGAELVVLHVVNEPAFAVAEGNGYLAPAVVAEYENAMKTKLQGTADALASSGAKVSAKVVRGTPHDAIVSAAESEKVDLIVMGTHGRTGIGQLLLGSVAERVVRLSKVPVMTIRTP